MERDEFIELRPHAIILADKAGSGGHARARAPLELVRLLHRDQEGRLLVATGRRALESRA
jgi:hypothetical protein